LRYECWTARCQASRTGLYRINPLSRIALEVRKTVTCFSSSSSSSSSSRGSSDSSSSSSIDISSSGSSNGGDSSTSSSSRGSSSYSSSSNLFNDAFSVIRAVSVNIV
jgi:hypothetical protein